MYDPMTVAWEIKSPWKREHKFFPKGYRNTLVTIWHVDPEKDGTDDSCGWFKRARHGDQEMLKKVESAFRYSWDSYYDNIKGKDNPVGWFYKDGSPRLPVVCVVLQMFNTAAWEYFFYNRRKADRFLNKNLLDILLFSANNVDSLFDRITMKYEILCDEKPDREERIKHFASIIYAWILREEQRWYQHPRWHIHHWKFQFNFLKRGRG
jgi:hypothetical protein